MANAKPVAKIEAYGIYVVAADGFVKVRPYNSADNYVDFKHLHEITPVIRKGNELKLIVFSKDFNERGVDLKIRPIQTTVEISKVEFSVKPLAEKDMHELTVDTPVKDGHMVHVDTGYFFDGRMGVVMLGDTEAELVKYFSVQSHKNAIFVAAYLDDALQAFPKNQALLKLKPYWDKQATREKDQKAYSYVEEKWQQYQGTTKLKLKARYLNDMIGEINAYLRDHPDGEKAQEAKTRKQFAEDELKKIEQQL